MKRIVSIFISASLFLLSCKKTDTSAPKPEPEKPKTITETFKEIASVVLLSAKTDTAFKRLAYEECEKQKFGDYYVKLDDLISLNSTYNFWNTSTENKLADLEKSLHKQGLNDVIIFIPSIETFSDKAKILNKPTIDLNKKAEPIVVVAKEYAPKTATCPGYMVETNGKLFFYQTIDESYAWENDVWVVGEEEVLDPESMMAAPEDTAVLAYNRIDGSAEYGGIVKVTDWSLVEPWVAGKVEFRMIVYKGAGEATKIYDEKFKKWRRANFRNKFKDFNRFLYYWNKANIGEYTSEKWIEQDGGPNATLTFGIKLKILGQESNIGVSLPIKNNDDDLGLSLIQFSDPIGAEYYQSGIVIKRKN